MSITAKNIKAVKEFLVTNDSGSGVSFQSIKKEFSFQIDESKLDDILFELAYDGQLYQPRPEYYKIMEISEQTKSEINMATKEFEEPLIQKWVNGKFEYKMNMSIVPSGQYKNIVINMFGDKVFPTKIGQKMSMQLTPNALNEAIQSLTALKEFLDKNQ